jgi:leucyl/phenylalanyl-tRNA---protein transferase
MAIARFGAQLDPDTLLRLYRHGMFPMADSAHDPNLFIVDPELRGIIPLDDFHVSRSLKKRVRSGIYEVTADRAFAEVVKGCAAPLPGRENTWINPTIYRLYTELHRRGHAHSVETWHRGELVGGLYGVSLGRAFFGESMFSTATDASKVALLHLVARLLAGGYTLLDTQFVNDHLVQFGVVEVERADFLVLLDQSLEDEGDFHRVGPILSGQDALQLITQMS